LLLSALGGTLGLLIGLWGAGTLVALASETQLPLRLDIRLDGRMLAFTALVSFTTAIVFGLLPALRSARPNLVPALKDAPALSIRTSGFRLGKSLVIGQIALSLVLLVAAGLFLRSLMNLRSIDLGFNPDRVLVLRVDSSSAGSKVPLEERRNIYARLIERAESVQGVRGASLSFGGLLSDNMWGNRITVEGRTAPADEPERTFANSITPRYFQVMGMQVLRGRSFSDTDRANAPPVAIVNETFARQFFNDPAPMGRRVGLGAPAKVMMEVVGVVGDAKYGSMRESAVPMLYVPFTQYDGQLGQLQVRTAADPATLSSQLRRELGSVDGRMAIVDVMEMQDAVDASLLGETLIAKLSTLFGMLALLLSAVGLYGVVAYMSAQRTVEVGIRMALGADRRSVTWLVLRQVVNLVLVGLLVGAPAAFFASRLVGSQLYGMTPNDPVAIALAILMLSAVALVAGCIPARRASRIDPSVALKAN
jgi:predicted permease